MSESATLILDASMLRNIENYQTRIKSPGQLQTYSTKVQFFTDLLEDNWETLPESVKSAIRVYAYSLMEKKPTAADFFKSMLFFFRVWSSKEILAEFWTALVRLDNVVLDLIERENSGYYDTLNRALGEVEHTIAESTTTTTDELREWMQSL